MGGAARSRNVSRLILYEPSLGLRYPAGYIERMESLVAVGDFEAAIISVYVDLVGATNEQVDAVRLSPAWPSRLATAPTIAREARIERDWTHQPGQFATIKAPTLLLAGSDSPADLAEITRQSAAAIPRAKVHVLEGHGHFAYRTHPADVAVIISPFIRSRGTSPHD